MWRPWGLVGIGLLIALVAACEPPGGLTGGPSPGGSSNVAPPPPPPPPPGFSAAGPTIPTAPLAGANIDIGRMMQDLISLSNQAADELSRVTDAASARAAAPRVQPILDRQDHLINQLAALRIQLPPEQFQPFQARYGEQVRASSERALAEQARVMGNFELLAAWGEGLKAAAGAAPTISAPATAPGDAQALDQKIAVEGQMAALLESIADEATARAAQPQIRQLMPQLEQANRNMMAAMVRSSAIVDQMMNHSAEDMRRSQERLDAAAEHAARGPGAGVVRQELIDLVTMPLRLSPTERMRSKAQPAVQSRLEQLGLAP